MFGSSVYQSLRLYLQAAVTMAAPFFPTYAADRFEASESLVGFTFACNPIAQVILVLERISFQGHHQMYEIKCFCMLA